MVEADFLLDAVLGGGLAHVIENPRPIGDRLRLGPRLERIAQREHVAVGADAGIAEQVPGAADAVAALENDITFAGTFLLKMITRADAGQSGADNQHVEMFWLHTAASQTRIVQPQLRSVNGGPEKRRRLRKKITKRLEADHRPDSAGPRPGTRGERTPAR